MKTRHLLSALGLMGIVLAFAAWQGLTQENEHQKQDQQPQGIMGTPAFLPYVLKPIFR